uniref:Uncharacterized protein n=1 Tax=Caenorhabditis japonica TaxID=281687 RepID=A0A8R1DMB8_CAEJA
MTTTTMAATQTSVGTPPPVFRNYMTLHNNNINMTKDRMEVRPPTPPELHTYSNPNFSISEPCHNGIFSRQEPSSVIERESTAPCVSPESSSHVSQENDAVEIHHAHFKPELSLPFIDADSVSSMVGTDDLRRAMSIRVSASVTIQEAVASDGDSPNLEVEPEKIEVEDENDENGGFEDEHDEKPDEREHHVTIADDEQHPSTSRESDKKDEVMTENHEELKGRPMPA